MSNSIPDSKEPLNNKPYILVKHAIQAFFQNTGLIIQRFLSSILEISVLLV